MAADSIPHTVLQHVEGTARAAVWWLVDAHSIPSTVQRTMQGGDTTQLQQSRADTTCGTMVLPYYVGGYSTRTVVLTRRGYYYVEGTTSWVYVGTLGLCVW